MKERCESRESGFTLVELIVVLVILAILAALLVPALVGYIDRARQASVLATARDLKTAAQAVAVDFYVENNGSWTTWNKAETVYKGISEAGKGTQKLQAFIDDVTALAEVSGITNYEKDPDGSNHFFISCVTARGKIRYLFYVDGLHYADIDSEGKTTTGRLQSTDEVKAVFERLHGSLSNNFGGNSLAGKQSYVTIE